MKKATVMDVDDPLNERPALPPLKSIVGRQQDDKDKAAQPQNGDTGGTGGGNRKGGKNAKPSKIKNIKVSWTWFTFWAGVGIGAGLRLDYGFMDGWWLDCFSVSYTLNP